MKAPKIFSSKSKGGAISVSDIIFNSKNPHVKSLASAILLRNFFRLKDKDFINQDFNVWLKFREKYLKKILKQKGDLVCSYCGKPHLKIGGRKPEDLKKNNKNPNLATIDHIIALSAGGDKFNEKNLCVSCKKCNRNKGDIPVELFIKKNNFKKL